MQLLRKKGLLDSPRVLFLPVDAISPNPNQPRRVFGTQELEELAGSIQALGLLQPLTVRRRADGWELVAPSWQDWKRSPASLSRSTTSAPPCWLW